MKRRIWILSIVIIALSHLFSYENEFTHAREDSGTEKISLQHSPEFSEISGGYTRLAKMGDGHTTEAGLPELPQFTTYYQVDPFKTYEFQFEVLESYTIEDITILPHQGMEKWEVDVVSIINEQVYNSYEPLPAQNMIVSDRAQGRGIEFVSVHVIPYTYYPKYNRLEVYTSIDIQVIETGENPNGHLNQPKRSHIFDEYYKDLLVNFEYSDRPEDYQASAILYICGGNWLNNSYVQDLLNWRHKQGYIVYTYDTPSSNENTIKNYIQDAYDNWENPPEIVGLIGDTDVIDNFYHTWSSYTGATDFDYTQLDGNDLIPEIFIGRISGQGSSVMDNVVNKTIQYEKALNVSDDWFKGAALVGDPYPSGISNVFTNQYIENIMINHGMDDVDTDYDGSGITNFMIQQFNEGVLYYNYRGWYYGSGSGPSDSFSNGYYTPFVTTLTCGTGDFDYGNSSSEAFVKMGTVNNPKGAVAAVGVSTAGTHTAYNNIVDMGIYDGIFSKDLWYAGAATSNGHLSILATYPSNPNGATETFIAWTNLIGDPALHLWTGVPTDFNFDHPSSISLGTTMLDLTIMDENGSIVKDARVTLLMGDDVIFTTGLTDENGQISLNWDAVEAGTMDITVIKRNHRPYEGTIEILSVGTAVSLSSDVIYANSGELTEFEIELYNYGTQTAENVIAELSSLSDQVTINQGITNFGSIPTGSYVIKQIPVYIHETAYDLEEMGFQLIISDEDGNSWINHVPVNIMGPHLIITDYNGETIPGVNTEFSINIENEGSKSADDILVELLPYENYITINSEFSMLENLSAGDDTILNGFDISFNQNIINGSVLPLELLLTGSDGYSRIENINITVGEVRETDPLGPDPYGYYIYDSGDTDYDFAPEYDWIDIATSGNNLNLVDYGNGCFNSNTSQCDGYGAADYGDYTESSNLQRLPFVFTFYGKDYENIIINTNGWISFGEFDMYSFRNYPIPGAGGPSPMVAAFWDDLKITSSGNVFYNQDFENLDGVVEKIIIQWDNMRTYDNGSYETFQMILYNKELFSPTSTGDSELKIQYYDFNNTSNGYYPSGGTPTHGCYSTIGIENHFGDVGLQYTFNNTYPEAAATLQDGSAIFITTRVESSFILGDYNGDGVLDVLDVVGLVNAVLSGGYSEPGDMNQDGVLDILDIVTLVNAILGG